MTAFARDDMPAVQQADGIDVRFAESGGMTLLWSRLRKGVDLGPTLAGLPNAQCSAPHWGYMISGKLLMRTNNGDEVYSAGEAFYWAPGHVPIALEDCECIDFAPNDAYAEMLSLAQ